MYAGLSNVLRKQRTMYAGLSNVLGKQRTMYAGFLHPAAKRTAMGFVSCILLCVIILYFFPWFDLVGQIASSGTQATRQLWKTRGRKRGRKGKKRGRKIKNTLRYKEVGWWMLRQDFKKNRFDLLSQSDFNDGSKVWKKICLSKEIKRN